MILRTVAYFPAEDNREITLRCPVCRHEGTFNAILANDIILGIRNDETPTGYTCGQRICPNPECKAHIFFVYSDKERTLVASYPAERIDFDSTNLPQSVLSSLEEAITCHANNCYVAAAIMVRKTLEELCKDRGATGNNLKDKLKSLGSKVILPQELLDGLDHLRLLGNDAAHIESRHYNQVGEQEVSIGIEVTKEVLKAVYQYSSLIDKLKSLQKTS